MIRLSRRTLLGGMAGTLAASASTRLLAQAGLTLPSSPVALNIVDVAGNLPYDVQRLAHETWDDVHGAGEREPWRHPERGGVPADGAPAREAAGIPRDHRAGGGAAHPV